MTPEDAVQIKTAKIPESSIQFVPASTHWGVAEKETGGEERGEKHFQTRLSGEHN